jgi:hypothetical protein
MPRKGERKPVLCGHPERQHYSLNKCRPCWMRDWGPTWRKNLYIKNPVKRQAKWRLAHLRETLRSFKVTQDEFDAMLAAQGCVCKICVGPPVGKKRLSIDHDHATNTVRGLLCDRCNVGLAQFQENPKLLLKAAEYLESYS